MRCKRGDLAVVIHSRREENLGRLVEVIAPYRGGYQCPECKCTHYNPRSPDWIVRSLGGLFKAAGAGPDCRYSSYADAALRPLPKDPDALTLHEMLVAGDYFSPTI